MVATVIRLVEIMSMVARVGGPFAFPMVRLTMPMMRLVVAMATMVRRLAMAVVRIMVSRMIVVRRVVLVMLMVVMASTASRARRGGINHELDCQIFAGSLTPRKNLLDERLFINFGPARLLPLHEGPQLVRKETLLEYMVRDVRQTIMRSSQIPQLDALRNDLGIMASVQVHVAEPEHGREVLDHELQSRLGGDANAILQQLIDDLTSLDTFPILALPPSARTVPRLDVSLKEHMISHILQIHKPNILKLELNKLSSRRKMVTRREMVRNPKLGSSHVDKVNLSRRCKEYAVA